MIEQVINSILDAEAEAEKIISVAEENAKTTEINTETECRKIKDDAISEFKAFRRSQLELKEKQATELYNEILVKGKETAREIETKAMKYSDAVALKIAKEFSE